MRTLKGFTILTLALLFFAKALQWASFTSQAHFGWVFLAMSLIGIVYGAYTLNTEVGADGSVRPLMTNTHIGWALGLTVMLITGLWMTNLVSNSYFGQEMKAGTEAADARAAIELKVENGKAYSRCLQGINESKAYMNGLYEDALDEQVANMRANTITMHEFDQKFDELNSALAAQYQSTVGKCDKLLTNSKAAQKKPATTQSEAKQQTKLSNPLTMAVEYFLADESTWLKLVMALLGMFILMGVANELGKKFKFGGYLLWMVALLVGITAVWGYARTLNIPTSNRQPFQLLTPKESASERDVRNWGPDNTRSTRRIGAPPSNTVRDVNAASVADNNNCVHNDLLSYEQPWVHTNHGISNKPVIVTITRSSLAAQNSEPCGPDGCPEQRTAGFLPYPQMRHMRMLARVNGTVIPFTNGAVLLDPAELGSGEISISTNQVRRKPSMGLGATNEWRQMQGEFCFEVRYAAGT